MPIWWRLVRFGFRLLYNELAFTYDWVSQFVSFGAWRCWQRASLKYLDTSPGALVLELAHGTGDLQLDLKAAGYRSLGYDLSASMGRIAGAKLKRHDVRADLARGRAQQLPFAAQTFAAVVSTFPTDFILSPATLNEVYRVLAPGGRLVIVPSAAFTGGGVSKSTLDWLYRITGQREPDAVDVEAIFTPYGFDARREHEVCPRSLATVVIAQKRG